MNDKLLWRVAVVALLANSPVAAKEKSRPAPAPTQQPEVPGAVTGNAAAGQWNCQFSYAELNPQGQPTSGFNRQFVIALYDGGSFEAQGTEAGASGYSQFYSQGQWQQTQGPQGAVIMAQGSYQSNDPYALPGMVFAFNGQLQMDGSMSFTYEQPDPNRQYVMNRTNYFCQRGG